MSPCLSVPEVKIFRLNNFRRWRQPLFIIYSRTSRLTTSHFGAEHRFTLWVANRRDKQTAAGLRPANRPKKNNLRKYSYVISYQWSSIQFLLGYKCEKIFGWTNYFTDTLSRSSCVSIVARRNTYLNWHRHFSNKKIPVDRTALKWNIWQLLAMQLDVTHRWRLLLH